MTSDLTPQAASHIETWRPPSLDRGLPECACPAGCGGRPEAMIRLAPAYPTIVPGDLRPPTDPYEPTTRGELVYDALNRRTGSLMARLGGVAYLRPEGGGVEWEVPLSWLQRPGVDS
ncbi:hypothetical protein OG500_14105 [Kitasatospora sp. NBC_01250]|uniref:hypothetical protein n=1 Tax=unclassified Kitasatospora TaxID=2633591 RepID=UPI002E0DB52E|nr:MULTISPECIES: hypothetical protein [unclassified Kitasatospora]WSJ67382.1 hypothetical protein OG294_15375 [Kitasatospora sp. NBC_01302]